MVLLVFAHKLLLARFADHALLWTAFGLLNEDQPLSLVLEVIKAFGISWLLETLIVRIADFTYST